MRPRIVAATAAVVLAGGVVGTAPVGVVPAAHAEVVDPEVDPCVEANDPTQVPEKAPEDPSESLADLQIADAQRIAQELGGRVAGTGVRVAVIDSGVYTDAVQPAGPPYQSPPDLSAVPEPTFYHGTAMAGIIAGAPDEEVGPIGIAPGATILDVRVYDTEVAQDGLREPTEASVIDGLRQVAEVAGTGPGDVRIVNLSIAVKGSSDALRAAVKAVTDTGAILVTSTGNRSGTEDEPGTAYEPGEDTADTWYPAGYAKGDADPLVVAVGTTTAPEESQETPAGLLSSAIDVVAPSYGAVSYTINGSTCVFAASSTSVATAEVSGILAMLMTAFPRASARELIARLEGTATGGAATQGGTADKYAGRGVVQPIDALTRPLPPGGRGGADRPAEQVAPAVLPQDEPDVLSGTRRNAVWWGLFGGGALVVALLLRPVLSRRRT